MLAQADQSARQNNFVLRIPEVAAAQALALLHQGDTEAAAHLTQTYYLPAVQARVLLAQGDAPAALAVLGPLRQHVEEKGLKDEQLKAMVLEAVALHLHGEKAKALEVLTGAMVLAEPGGFIRLFLDEGMPMAQLLSEATARGIMPDYVRKLLSVFETVEQKNEGKSPAPLRQPLMAPLSARELEVLRLIAQGLSNREISERLFLALSTVKGHSRIIFDKLQVKRRTEAVARARELGLL
jgi:LuxR family maltose regulon positive regulatory protein